jgi:hypothetical protein
MDSATGAVTDWDPNPDLWVQKLLLVNDVLYPSGVFFRIGGQTGRGIAAFSLSSPEPPVFDTTSLARLDDGRFQLRVMVSGATQVTIWASADFSAWQNLGTAPVISGSAEFTDDQAPGQAQRFYRASVP